MLTPEQRAAVAEQTRVMQIIIFALVVGASTYLVFAIANRGGQNDSNLAHIGVAMAIGCAAAALFLPLYLAGQHRRAVAEGVDPATGAEATRDDASMLLGGLQIRKIIRAALLEGAAFMNTFVVQSGGPTYSLGIAAALILGIAMTFPLRPLIEEWLDRELRTVNEIRQLRR